MRLRAGVQQSPPPSPTPIVPHLQVGGAPDGVLDGTLLSKELVALSLLVVVLGLQALLLHLESSRGTHKIARCTMCQSGLQPTGPRHAVTLAQTEAALLSNACCVPCSPGLAYPGEYKLVHLSATVQVRPAHAQQPKGKELGPSHCGS
jgi:hypothetical protein